MRRLALLSALLLAFSMTALAQYDNPAGAQTGAQSTTKKAGKNAATTSTQAAGTETAAKTSQLTGCLAKDPSGSGYKLTNGHYTKGVEVTSSQDLSAHVGHKVQLTGTWEKPAGGGAKSFTATNLKHISDTCSTTSAKKSGAPSTETNKK